jgi:hypothetical protein
VPSATAWLIGGGVFIGVLVATFLMSRHQVRCADKPSPLEDRVRG